jgi:hypothetical protein
MYDGGEISKGRQGGGGGGNQKIFIPKDESVERPRFVAERLIAYFLGEKGPGLGQLCMG